MNAAAVALGRCHLMQFCNGYDIMLMPYEQCNKCELEHCCYSLGSFLEDDNKPNECKFFIPKK